MDDISILVILSLNIFFIVGFAVGYTVRGGFKPKNVKQ